MSAERKMILNMLKDAKISVQEAVKLLEAVKDKNASKTKMHFNKNVEDVFENIKDTSKKAASKTADVVSNIDFEAIKRKVKNTISKYF